MTHELKILPIYFKAVLEDKKLFEIRKNDRDYKVGDTLKLKEWCPAGTTINEDVIEWPYFTGKEIVAEVTYVLKGGKYGLDKDYCVLGIKKRGIINE